MYEEVTWPHATLQFGGRLDHTNYQPEITLPARDFTEWSGSVGLLIRPAAANDNFVIALSTGRAARAPALEELYFFGPHLGNFAFEIGNPDLPSEHARGFDISFRARGKRFEGELAFFNNDIKNYVFRNPISDEEFAAREDEFDERFGVVDDGSDPNEGDLPYVEYASRDSRLWGVEAHGDVKLTPNWIAEFTYDMVRGELKDTGDPLPRIPPYRGILGLNTRRTRSRPGRA